MTMVTSPRIRLLRTASRSAGSRGSEPPSVHHQRMEKPCQLERLRPRLKEKTMAISTGTIDHTTYSQVMPASTRGLFHGWPDWRRPRRGRRAVGVPESAAGATTTGGAAARVIRWPPASAPGTW